MKEAHKIIGKLNSKIKEEQEITKLTTDTIHKALSSFCETKSSISAFGDVMTTLYNLTSGKSGKIETLSSKLDKF